MADRFRPPRTGTDGFKAYMNPIEEVFGTDVDYAMMIKVYGGEQTETRYSPAEGLGKIRKRVSECFTIFQLFLRTSPF